MEKVLGDINPGDLMTKNLAQAKVEEFIYDLSQEYKTGRAETSLKMAEGAGEEKGMKEETKKERKQTSKKEQEEEWAYLLAAH